MRPVTYWSLSDDDRRIVDRLAAGLGERSATVFTYLLLRREQSAIADETATRLSIRIGTGLGRTAVTDALSKLEERNLVSQTTKSDERDRGGRPPKAWRAIDDVEVAYQRVYDEHADELVGQAHRMLREDIPGSNRYRGDDRGPLPPGSSSVDTTEDSRKSPRRLTVALNWYPNPLHVPLYAARMRGAYTDRDLIVTFDHYQGSRRALDVVVDGDADVALVGAGTLSQARTAETSVVPLAVLFQRAMTVLYTTRDVFQTPFETVEQLRGATIATAAGSETQLLTELFLAWQGIRSEIDILETDGEERAVLSAGRADVATGTFADVLALEAEGTTVDSVVVADHFPIYGPTFAVKSSRLEPEPADRDALSRFIAGTTAGWALSRTDTEAVVSDVVEELGGSPDQVRRRFEDAVSRFGETSAVEKHGWGWHDPETWGRIETALAQGNRLE